MVYLANLLCYLLFLQIYWPESWGTENSEIFLITVDGVHCRVRERNHPTLYRDTSIYSHKFKQAGLDYELAISIREPRLVHMYGPVDASVHDLTIFRESGLKEKIPPGYRGLGDTGYNGEPGVLSTRNANDEKAVGKFKSRALARHETFNMRIKMFGILAQVFRHDHSKHKIVFEAVCVLVQYQMDNGNPLFDL